MIDGRVLSLLAEFEVEVVGKSAYPREGQTRAIGTLDRILKKRGEDHLRLVLVTVVESARNKALMDETLLWAASDLIMACPDVVERQTSAWLECWDEMPVGRYQWIASGLSGKVNQRSALAGMLYLIIAERFGDIRLAA